MDERGQSIDPTMPRLFTVAEARALLPVLRPILVGLRDDKRQSTELRERLGELSSSARQNGAAAEAEEVERRIALQYQKIARQLEELSTLGVFVKDIDHGLVDFPSLRDGRPVLLCWHLGEPDVAWWHPLDTGFSGRQPL